jgi:hypothetical protein
MYFPGRVVTKGEVEPRQNRGRAATEEGAATGLRL